MVDGERKRETKVVVTRRAPGEINQRHSYKNMYIRTCASTSEREVSRTSYSRTANRTFLKAAGVSKQSLFDLPKKQTCNWLHVCTYKQPSSALVWITQNSNSFVKHLRNVILACKLPPLSPVRSTSTDMFLQPRSVQTTSA
jgi:hypothetical protein